MRKVLAVSFMVILAVFIMYMVTWEDGSSKYKFGNDLVEQVRAHVPNYVTIDQIPHNLIHAVVAVEDQRFFKHVGFDPVGIVRALVQNIKNGEISEGASTITQQLAKNLFLTQEKTLERKARELFLAIKLEQIYTKEQILEMYLNVIYFGEGAYGIQSASKTYYHKNTWELSLEECATLAGLPQAPSAYNPKKHADMAEKRKRVVFDRMKKYGLINKPGRGYAVGSEM